VGGLTEGARLLLPVGHLLGASYPTLGSAEHTVHVRVGPDLVELDDAAFGAWALAHGLPGGDTARPWTREALLRTAAERGVGDLTGAVSALLADRLLVEVPPGPAAAVAFAEQHRLVPLALGLGNDPDEPDTWSIGLLGRPLVTVTATLFDVFEWAHLDDDLWAACRRASERARRAGLTESAAVEPERLLTDVLGALHGLLSVDVACLDTRVARP
jgi:hypothetical protein